MEDIKLIDLGILIDDDGDGDVRDVYPPVAHCNDPRAPYNRICIFPY